MKTSNKLLIAFASALILIPLIGIAIISRVYYEKGDYSANGDNKMDTFGTIPKNMSAIPINRSFQSVQIDGGNQLYLVIKLVEDEKAGVKIGKNIENLISAEVNSSGQLQVTLKKSDKQPQNYARIWIYGPHMKELNVVNGRGVNLNTKMDSLTLNLTNTSTARFDADAKVDWLNIHTSNVGDITFRETGTRSVNLDLKDTNVKSDMSSFDNLSINAAGNSKIELHGGYGETTDKSVKHLTLNTYGKASVKIFNMKIDSCSGKFSDSTTVEMPALNINQMYNSKK